MWMLPCTSRSCRQTVCWEQWVSQTLMCRVWRPWSTRAHRLSATRWGPPSIVITTLGQALLPTAPEPAHQHRFACGVQARAARALVVMLHLTSDICCCCCRCSTPFSTGGQTTGWRLLRRRTTWRCCRTGSWQVASCHKSTLVCQHGMWTSTPTARASTCLCWGRQEAGTGCNGCCR